MAVRLGAVAAGNRDVELGIAPHAVLVAVEAFALDRRVDADAPDLVQHPETAVRGGEDEALRPGRQVRRQLRHREQSARMRAPEAGHAVIRYRADRGGDADPLDED